MADRKATPARGSTAAPVGRSPRFLLPRASGGTRLPALPSQPSSPVLVLDGGIRASFDGWPAAEPLDRWGQWVAKLRPLHEPLWRELGILEGILATTYRVRRGGEGALLQLVPFWSSETNTFVFPWGEATVTLEDVAVLVGLPLAGESVRESLSDQLQLEDERALGAVRDLLMNQSKGTGWIKYFRIRQLRRPEETTTAAAAGGRDEEQLEHGAFLSMWLSCFVLPSPSFDAVVPGEEVIPIAVRLARGRSVALAPAALASIYSDLSALRRHFVWAKRTEALSVSAPMHILQLWVWERFPELRPSAPACIPDSAGGDVPVPRAARWHDVAGRALDPGYLHAVLAAPKVFEWRPYGSRAVLPFARCLHPCELVGMDSVEHHRPHRVARQLGFDQDVPGIVTRLNSDSWNKAWETYDIGAGCYASAVPSDKPGVTDEYAQWWKQYTVSCAATAAADRAATAGNRERSSRRLAQGNTQLGSTEVCTKTHYYVSRSDRSKEAWEKDANSTGADQGFFHPKRAVGTEEMIQKASEIRQAEIAELMKNIAKLAKEIREEEAAEALKK
ncbi:hypothetical protein C2845_PM01G36710 [Panicum miliaceum]|uniref:Aminotransferase-like plant mobile domain-containing protein n=1 Tax=Panicum miliaceum TaxID=4540 RepID=A0A3L6TTW8_PANMI|nr:hypothetical protein C2845_PM01G36710 [Panicum miliaceum]